MGPLKPLASVPLPPITKPSLLDTAPNVVKTEILKCLQLPDVTTTATLNKGWQRLTTNNQVWVTIAQQKGIPIDPPTKPGRDAVMEHFYGSINRIFNDFLNQSMSIAGMSANEPVAKALAGSKDKTEKEKYFVILDELMRDPSEAQNIISNFMRYVTKDSRLEAQRAMKQMIKDDVLQQVRAKINALCESAKLKNVGMFRLILKQIKGTKDSSFIMSEAFFSICWSGPSALFFLKILCEEEGMRPNTSVLKLAADRIDFESPNGDQHLKLLLDYSDFPTRNLVIDLLDKNLKTDLELNTRLSLSESLKKGRAATIQENHSRKLELIRSAPSPTFGAAAKNNEASQKQDK